MGIAPNISNILQHGSSAEGPGTPATGAVAGTPGHFTPLGSDPPTVAGMTAITASPAAVWQPGEYVAASDGNAYWDGAAWHAGIAP